MEGDEDVEQRALGNLPTMLDPRRMHRFLQERLRRCRKAQKLLLDPQQGQAQHIRSLNNNERSYVKFCNRTTRKVALYWIDYEGQAVSFGILPSGFCVDMDTYVTHPWIFVDPQTDERFRVKQNMKLKDVYFPEPYGNLPRLGRTLVSIISPMYTLQQLASRVVMGRLKRSHDVYKLEIPRVLQKEISLQLELKEWEVVVQRPNDPSCSISDY